MTMDRLLAQVVTQTTASSSTIPGVTGGGGGGTVESASNLGGGLDNFSALVGTDLQFNSFAAADFNLAANALSVDRAIAGTFTGVLSLTSTANAYTGKIVTLTPANNTTGLSITGASNTVADATTAINLAQTWNTSGVITALKLNVTDTASGSGSKIVDVQRSSASIFAISNNGSIVSSPVKTGAASIHFNIAGGDVTASAYTGAQTALNVKPLVNASSGTPAVLASKYDLSSVRGTVGALLGLETRIYQSNSLTSTASPDYNAGVNAGIDCQNALTLTRFAGFQCSYGDQYGSGQFNATSVAGFRYYDPAEWGGGGGTIARLYGVLVDPDQGVANGSVTAFWAGAFGGDVEIDNDFRLFWSASNATAIASRAAAVRWNSGGSTLDCEVGTSVRLAIGAANTVSANTINGTTIPTSKTLVVTTDKLSALAATSSLELKGVISDETGSGALVFADTPTLVTPVLGTPTSGTLTSCTGLPISTGVSGLGANVATMLATPTSANFLAACSDETGTGLLTFATNPTFTGATMGTTTVLAGDRFTITGGRGSLGAGTGVIGINGVTTSGTLGLPAPRSGSIISIGVGFTVTVKGSNGTVDFELRKGTTVVGKVTATITATGDQSATATFTRTVAGGGAAAFAAGDILNFNATFGTFVGTITTTVIHADCIYDS
jgi:hypothetical protein